MIYIIIILSLVIFLDHIIILKLRADNKSMKEKYGNLKKQKEKEQSKHKAVDKDFTKF